MYNLRTNYLRIFQICKDSLHQHFVSGHNFNVYRHAPKMADLEVVSLSITADVVGIFSENCIDLLCISCLNIFLKSVQYTSITIPFISFAIKG